MNDTIHRIKERLQIMAECGTPYVNEINTKGRGFPVARIMLALVVTAIIATLRGW